MVWRALHPTGIYDGWWQEAAMFKPSTPLHVCVNFFQRVDNYVLRICPLFRRWRALRNARSKKMASKTTFSELFRKADSCGVTKRKKICGKDDFLCQLNRVKNTCEELRRIFIGSGILFSGALERFVGVWRICSTLWHTQHTTTTLLETTSCHFDSIALCCTTRQRLMNTTTLAMSVVQ